MTTYRDHPLAFLASRVSAESLRGRQDMWRSKGIAVEGLDVIALLGEAADLVEASTQTLRSIYDDATKGIAASLERLRFPASEEDADRLFAAGQFLREDFRDPSGGSTASHLEMAADEIRHLLSAMRDIKGLHGKASPDVGAVLLEAGNALDIPVAEANYEAPVQRM